MEIWRLKYWTHGPGHRKKDGRMESERGRERERKRKVEEEKERKGEREKNGRWREGEGKWKREVKGKKEKKEKKFWIFSGNHIREDVSRGDSVDELDTTASLRQLVSEEREKTWRKERKMRFRWMPGLEIITTVTDQWHVMTARHRWRNQAEFLADG